MAETEGYGTTLGYAATLGGSYTTLSEVVSIECPEVSLDDIETTHLTSTGKWKTFQSGLKDAGELSATIHFDKTVANTLYTTLLGATNFFKVTFADGSTLAVEGYLKSIGPETPIDDIVTVTITVKLSGAPTFTPMA